MPTPLATPLPGLRHKRGFTLIEIVATVVILAVLAAIAIPRYVSLIEEARQRALEGAIAAGLSHLSLTYGRLALATGIEPNVADIAAEANAQPPDTDDFTYVFAPTPTPGVAVTTTELETGIFATREWVLP
ncbi:MAG TPA: prepilin-type N-terminal cleavage/methylation domain-containing protein [Kiritimatiellia bacterium]|nr:prepilin-type N-terminal cleavage/methylation domain-containing protein [Kiritimatiellia bacterium]